MTLKNALKLKNLLIQEIQELNGLIRSNNSIMVGNKREYSPTEQLVEYDSKVLELVKLKASIQQANVPVHEKIFLLSELKTKVALLKGIGTQEGKARGGYGQTEPDFYEVELNQKQIREMVKGVEEQIRDIQNDLDEFNSITSI